VGDEDVDEDDEVGDKDVDEDDEEADVDEDDGKGAGRTARAPEERGTRTP
jgi:hypothetical protein